MSKYYFVTGTDTDVGKTFCACVVTSVLRKNGLTVRVFLLILWILLLMRLKNL